LTETIPVEGNRVANSRFAFYLIPPYSISKDIAEIHAMLNKQYGFKAAGRFQVHCTIKGFFKKSEGSLEHLIRDLDILLFEESPFQVEINGIISTHNALMLDLSRLGDTYNQQLSTFRNRVIEVIHPYIAPDCNFTKEDLGQPFMGHITLAFRDSPDRLHGHVLSWLENARIPSGDFHAKTFHFLEFFSNDWEGSWWETLTWKLHKSWVL
jgi:2'-5' RNA ligase